MDDNTTTIKELRTMVNTFIDERDWQQFHFPKSLSISIALEAAELMEKFQWCGNKQSSDEAIKQKDAVTQELADVIITALCFARATDIDIATAVRNKMEINRAKYPIQKAKGVYTKYDKL